MEQLFRLLFVGLLGGLSLSLSLEAAQCRNLYKGEYQTSFCCDTSSGRTCLTTFLGTNNHPVRKPFYEASRWCKSSVPGSSLIIIDSLDSLRTLERFIESRILAYETIITDAQQLSARDSTEWSWVNGHSTIPINVRTEALPGLDGACVKLKHGQSLAYCTGTHQSRNRYICEYSESNSTFSYRHNNKSFVASEVDATWYDARTECLRLGGDLASISDLQTIEKWSQLKENQKQKYWIGLHRNKWIWKSTGAALTYTKWEGGYPDEVSDNQCVCIKPQCRRENNRTIKFCELDRKWRICNCSHNYAIVCQKKEETSGAVTTEVVVTGNTLSSTSEDFKSSVSLPAYTTTSSLSSSSSSSVSLSALSTTKSPSKTTTKKQKRSSSKANPTTSVTPATITITTSTKTLIATTPTTTGISTRTPTATTTTSTKTTVATTTTTTKTTTATAPPFSPEVSTVTPWKASSLTQKQKNHFSEGQTTALVSSSTELFSSTDTREILLILLFVAVVFIVVAVIIIIRKRRYKRRSEGSPMKNATQSEVVSAVYATVVPVNRPSVGTIPPGNTIYTDVEMTQQLTSFNTIYASVQPTSEAVDMGKSIVYSDLNFPQKGKQKPRSADKITACLSPIYSQPFEPRTSATNTEYAEPFNPGKRPTATAPVRNHNPASDQQNIYPLAKAIPLGDPNVIYSEPNKPTKSSTPTGKAVKTAGPIYLNMIEVKPGAESGCVAKQDPTAVYAEPIKLKKSP